MSPEPHQTRTDAPEETAVVSGVVVPGDQRGRLLGFPTANLPLDDGDGRHGGITDGVYAGTVIDETDGSSHLAAVSVGRRASFYGRDGERLLEAHLLDFSGDLYGHAIRVELHVKLRPQRRYRGAEALVEQLQRDVAATRTWSRERDAEPVHRGRRGPVRSRRILDADETERRRAARESHRLAALARSVDDLLDGGEAREATHELVAERSRIPVAYLRWAYPTTQDLLAAARRPL
ncbi:Riboflavin kinase [Rathayibacter oskolensis]|uniref:riboflavin kinase n=1 Tax=Rathayibacter oskolensis TaxID=1891671 RepID=A0A1X7MWA3_9MICO|nr:riboflavin kinase [Rathayibacter oskolensis]SMH28298.1 Riboflavin kinase [Rathayibacter oskolensis]